MTVLGTPGHRPEHLAYLAADDTPSDARTLLISGDSLLVGELARPDLAVEPQEGARALWTTVERLVALSDRVELWPGHVGGSLCGGGVLCNRTHSTIGEERRTNPLLSERDIETFVRNLTSDVPARPPRVPRAVALNLAGAGDPGPVRELDPSGVATFVGRGAALLDVRSSDAFDHGHLAGALNLPAGGQGLGTRAGWAIGPDEAIVIVCDSRQARCEAADLLYAAGVDNIAGISAGDPAGWEEDGLSVTRSRAFAPGELVPLLQAGDVQLIDVRDPREWRSGHMPGSLHLPLYVLGDGSTVAVSDRRPLAVACAGGRRAALAASVLRRRGRDDVSRLIGGVSDLAGRGLGLVVGD